MSIKQQIRDFYGLSDDEWYRLRSLTFDKRIYEYVSRKFWLLEQADNDRDTRYDTNALQRWQASYQAIKDPTWPDCETFNDFQSLPDNIQHECRTVHGLDPAKWLDQSIGFDDWSDDPSWDYEEFDLVRLKHIVFDNLEFIQGRRVVDFATHNGLIGGTCLHHGATAVTITNIKQDCLDLANEMLDLLDQDQRHKSILSDINNTNHNRIVCESADTIILAGILDIVQDHYGILKSITDCDPSTVIINNLDPGAIKNNREPLVHWWQEVTHTTWRGYSQDHRPVTVGCPNAAWFDFVMQSFGYKKHRELKYQVWEPFSDDLSKTQDLFDQNLLIYVK